MVAEFLTPQGFEVDTVQDGERGLERALSDEVRLIVLDVMLPGIDGFEVLRRIRNHATTPVLMLTAHGADVDRIIGLELGADDYLPKPFNPRELVARIRAILRRATIRQQEAERHARGERLVVDDVELDLGAREARLGDGVIPLTGAEFDLLEMLLRSAGCVVERNEIFRRVLDREPAPFDRSVDMHVCQLRKKLGHWRGDVERIKSVRGVGYIYTCSSDRA